MLHHNYVEPHGDCVAAAKARWEGQQDEHESCKPLQNLLKSTATMTTLSKVQDRAATAHSHTSVAKIRLVVVVAYMASDFIIVSGYLRSRFQVSALN